MKKLLLLAATVAMGVAANAAFVDWYIYDEVVAEDSTAYVFVGGSQASTLAAYLTSANYEDSSDFNAALAAVSAKTETTLAGGYGEGSSSGEANSSLSVLFLTSLDEGATIYYADSIDSTGSWYDGGQQGPGQFAMEGLQLTSGTIAYKAPGPVPPTPIPEPTSGLLMLLGMAGLALRRRRA